MRLREFWEQAKLPLPSLKAGALKTKLPFAHDAFTSVRHNMFSLAWRFLWIPPEELTQVLIDVKAVVAASKLFCTRIEKLQFAPEFLQDGAAPVPVDSDLVFDPSTQWQRRRTQGCPMTTRTAGPPCGHWRSVNILVGTPQPTTCTSEHRPNPPPQHPPRQVSWKTLTAVEPTSTTDRLRKTPSDSHILPSRQQKMFFMWSPARTS